MTRGQFLERATVIPTVGGVLEALSHRGTRAPPLLIVPPPPGSGGMDHPVGSELAWAVTRAGHPALRFNFRGVGASPGPPGPPEAEAEDIEAALRVLEESTGTVAPAVAALGGSATRVLALEQAHPGLAGVALVSPRLLEVEELARVRHPLLVVVGAEEPLPRAALAAAVAEAGGTLFLVPGADARFARNLPEVGRAVAQWLTALAASP
ncbi:MAG: alpha/beta hydrolase [Myxococcaceae bacterium]